MRTGRWLRHALFAVLCMAAPQLQADSELKQLLANGDYAAAWARAQALEAEQAGEVAFDYLYGRAALEAGEPDYAVFALERVLLLQPAHHRARVELARAYYELGNWDVAERHFQRVLAIDPPANVRANIEGFLAAIAAQRKLLDAQWSAYVELRTGYDSNANSATADSSVTIPALGIVTLSDASLEGSDHFLDKRAGFTWQKPLAKTRGLFVSLQYKDRENFDTQASDLRSVGVSAGPLLALGGGRLLVPVSAQALYLANDYYRKLFSVGASWTRPLQRQDELSLFSQLGTLRYPDQAARDVDMLLLGASWTHEFTRSQIAATFSAYLGDEDTRSDLARHNGKDYHGVRVALEWPLAPDHALYSSLTGQWSRHDVEDPVFVTTRKEDFAELVLGWRYDFQDPWQLSLEASAINNNSSISLYEYERRQLMLGVRYRWQ